MSPEVVENMRAWAHSGFSVDQSVFLPASDRAGIERLVAYMTRCPFSLARLVKVPRTGQVIYKAEKDACRAFPEAPRQLTFVPEEAIWAEADAFLDTEALTHDPPDDCYRQPPDDEPRELTSADEDAFPAEF